MSDFIRNGANQNINPEYVKMIGGISEELLGPNNAEINFWSNAWCAGDLKLTESSQDRSKDDSGLKPRINEEEGLDGR